MNSLSAPLTVCVIAVRAFIAKRLDLNEKGASMVEYALLVGLIAAVAVGLVYALGGQVGHLFSNTSTCIGNNGQTGCTPGAS